MLEIGRDGRLKSVAGGGSGRSWGGSKGDALLLLWKKKKKKKKVHRCSLRNMLNVGSSKRSKRRARLKELHVRGRKVQTADTVEIGFENGSCDAGGVYLRYVDHVPRVPSLRLT